MGLLKVISALDRSLGRLGDLAIVGTAKNVGKTTTLNWLAENLGASEAFGGTTLGVTSAGRDGEAKDAITELPKPRILPPLGTLVATSSMSAQKSHHALAWLAPTPFSTGLGPVGIYRVVASAPIEVAGPVAADALSAVVRMLHDLGAHRVIVDGAIDRKAAAASEAVDGVILATGLAMLDSAGPGSRVWLDPGLEASKQVHAVAKQTRIWGCMLMLPGLEPAIAALVPSDMPTDRTGAVTPAGQFLTYPSTPPLPAGEDAGRQGPDWGRTSLLESPEQFVRWIPPQTKVLYVAGALTESLAVALLKSAPSSFTLLVPSGTHVLCSGQTFANLGRRGIRLRARRTINVLAITANPTAPYRKAVDSKQLVAALRAVLPLPVFDLQESYEPAA